MTKINKKEASFAPLKKDFWLTKDSILFNGSKLFSFIRPASTTKTQSSMVMLVSAKFVDKTIFLAPFRGFSKTSDCSSDESDEWRGINLNFPAFKPKIGWLAIWKQF